MFSLGASVVAITFIIAALTAPLPAQVASGAFEATTTVSLTVCGDAIVSGTEVCDDGTNTGVYAMSIASRRCNPLCNSFGPYCGDGVIQPLYGEACDDSNNGVGDLCDAVCQNESPPVTEGGGGGNSSGGGGGKGSGNNAIPGASTEGTIPFNGNTEVLIRGKAYPGATITILRDGEAVRVIEADADAVFSLTLSDLTPGTATFGFWALDRAGRRSITYASTFQVIENAVTTLSGILVPPTIVAVPERVAPKGDITFSGSAVPRAELTLEIDETVRVEKALAGADGTWQILFNTSTVTPEATHRARANFTDPQNSAVKSGYSQVLNFYVGTGSPSATGTADLNGDGLVNLVDFSILLFNWNSTSVVADINKDGTVSLPDFSIMLFNWTG